MAHPYKQHKHAHKDRVKHLLHKYARGGAIKHDDAAEDASMIKKAMGDHDKQLHGGKHTDLSNVGPKGKGRLDKHARGGKVKHGKGHHTKINIVVAPKAGGDAGPAAGPMAGLPPPPMPPKTPMAPPPGGPMAGGPPPGAGGMPGMKRGGKVKAKPISGIASSGNIKKWSERASSNTKYARGGMAYPLSAETGGAESGSGRKAEHDHYGKKYKKK